MAVSSGKKQRTAIGGFIFMEREQLLVCGLCGDRCFLDVWLENGRIVKVAKAKERPHVHGNLCLRGAALKQYLYHPDRLRYPMRRAGPKGSGKFERISWEEAFATIGERLRTVREADGAKATVFYSGHPKWYRYMMAEVARDYGTPNFCTESSTCHSAREIAYELCYGCPVLEPDLKTCKTLICWGANPAYSKFSSMNGILDIPDRGGNLIVVDPRKTPTTEHAMMHLQLRPGTDGALALSMAHVILVEGLEDKKFLEQYACGLEEYRTYAAAFPPERGEQLTGVPAEQIAAAARIIALEGPFAIYTTSSGTAHAPNSVQSYRAVFLLEALTGNFDRPGGNHGPAGDWLRLNGFHHDARPRIHVEEEFQEGRFPIWNALIPNEGQAMGLDEAILSGHPYPIRNIVAFGMNFRMFPESEKMRKALLAAEFFVNVDLFLTDSSKYADLVLPCAAAPEREYIYHLPGNHLLYMPRVLEAGERLNDVEILQGICNALDLHGPLTGMRSFDEYMEWMLEPSGVTLEELKSSPEGIPARTTKKMSLYRYERGLETPSGKVEFVSGLLEPYEGQAGYDKLPVFRPCMEQNPAPEKYPFILCAGGRRPQFFHSRTYRVPWLANLEPHTLASLNPADAERLGIQDGGRLKVKTPIGERTYLAETVPGVLPGVIYIVHDDEGDQNVNDLIAADYLDPLSGFPGYRCYFCRVEPAGGAR